MAVESTGIQWVPMYTMLEEEFRVVVANPRQVKAIPGRKTDEGDAEWLAKLLKNGLIKPSYIPPRGTSAPTTHIRASRSWRTPPDNT